MKKLLLYAIVGMGIGFLITNVMFWLSSSGNDGLVEKSAVLDTVMEYTIWMIASALYGAATLILDSDRLSCASRTIIHFFVCMGITLLAWSTVKILLAGTFRLSSLFLLLIEFIIIYLAVTLATYRYARASVREINEKLKSKE